MATTLPIRKIYIDSRWCTPDSVSSSNFKVQVPRTMQMPDNTVFFVNDVCIPHTWTTVETGFNDKLYILLLDTGRNIYKSCVDITSSELYSSYIYSRITESVCNSSWWLFCYP